MFLLALISLLNFADGQTCSSSCSGGSLYSGTTDGMSSSVGWVTSSGDVIFGTSHSDCPSLGTCARLDADIFSANTYMQKYIAGSGLFCNKRVQLSYEFDSMTPTDCFLVRYGCGSSPSTWWTVGTTCHTSSSITYTNTLRNGQPCISESYPIGARCGCGSSSDVTIRFENSGDSSASEVYIDNVRVYSSSLSTNSYCSTKGTGTSGGGDLSGAVAAGAAALATIVIVFIIIGVVCFIIVVIVIICCIRACLAPSTVVMAQQPQTQVVTTGAAF